MSSQQVKFEDRPSEYSCDGNLPTLTAKIHNEKDVTTEDILAEADKVWQKCRDSKVDITDTDAVDELMARLRREHKDFCTSYPIVMRYMAQFNSYKREALDKYLALIKQRPWKSESEYLDSQADYVVILYKSTHKKWNTTEVNNLRRNIRSMLEKESKVFKQNLDASEKKVNSLEEQLSQESKEELKSYFSRILGSQPQLPPSDIVTLADD